MEFSDRVRWSVAPDSGILGFGGKIGWIRGAFAFDLIPFWHPEEGFNNGFHSVRIRCLRFVRVCSFLRCGPNQRACLVESLIFSIRILFVRQQ